MTWHIQPPKEAPLGESADEAGEGVEYEGKVLPQIRGAFRRRLPQYVDGMVYVDRTRARNGYEHTLQIAGDREKYCKFPVEVPEGVPEGVVTIPNVYKEYHKIIANAVGG